MSLEDYRGKSFWLSAGGHEPGPPLDRDLDVDVAIVGGGYSGLSAAYHLKKTEPDLRVALLESQVLGYGASGRNAGFSMSKIGMLHSMTALRFGKGRATEAHEYAERAVQYTRRIIGELGIDCDYEYPGLLCVACSDKHARRLEKEYDLAVNTLGLKGIEFIDHSELRSRVDSPLYVGGAWWEAASGMLNPAKLVWGWRDVIRGQGVEIFERSPVVDIGRDGRRRKLEVAAGGQRLTVRCDKAILAVNAWSHTLRPIRSKQAPLFTYIILTEPLGEAQLESIGWKGRETVEDFRNLTHYYRLTADNRLLWGGRDVGLSRGRRMDYDRDEAMFTALLRDLELQFPSLKGIRITHQWGGPVSTCMDFFPAMGYAGDKSLIYSLGWVGHGVSLTQYNGRTLADLALERDTELTRVFFVNRRTIPLPPDPLRRLAFGAVAGYMRWEDRRLDVF